MVIGVVEFAVTILPLFGEMLIGGKKLIFAQLKKQTSELAEAANPNVPIISTVPLGGVVEKLHPGSRVGAEERMVTVSPGLKEFCPGVLNCTSRRQYGPPA